MTISPEDRARLLARLSGIEIREDEITEVADRFQGLVGELDRLKELVLDGIEPVAVFPDDELEAGA